MISKNRKCNSCKSDIDKQATICMHCGSYQSSLSNLSKKYVPNGIAIVAVGLAIIQLYLANGEKSKAEDAANEARIARNETKIIEMQIQQKDSILKLLTKASFENSFIHNSQTLGIDNPNDSIANQLLNKNEKLILDILEPDKEKQKELIQKLKRLTPFSK